MSKKIHKKTTNKIHLPTNIKPNNILTTTNTAHVGINNTALGGINNIAHGGINNIVYTTTSNNVTLPNDFNVLLKYFKYIIAHLNIDVEYTCEDFIKISKESPDSNILESIIRDVKLKKINDEC